MITLIKNLKFEDLAFIILRNSAITDIFNLIIFLDLINKAVQIIKYLYLKLSKHIKIIDWPDKIIEIFRADLTVAF